MVICTSDSGRKLYEIEEYPDYEYIAGYCTWDGEIYKKEETDWQLPVCRTDQHISCKLKQTIILIAIFTPKTIKIMVFVYKYYILWFNKEKVGNHKTGRWVYERKIICNTGIHNCKGN